MKLKKLNDNDIVCGVANECMTAKELKELYTVNQYEVKNTTWYTVSKRHIGLSLKQACDIYEIPYTSSKPKAEEILYNMFCNIEIDEGLEGLYDRLVEVVDDELVNKLQEQLDSIQAALDELSKGSAFYVYDFVDEIEF